MNPKTRVARLSVFSNTFLIIMKLSVGLISGSVSIISEAIHSGMDLLAAVIAYFSVRVSDTPPDRKHPYGHGKYENISGVIEAMLIFVAAAFIIIEAIKKLLRQDYDLDILWIGALVMFISALVNFVVSRRLYKTAKETDSIALEADALHLKTDVYTSVGVAVGLGLIALTGIEWLDPVVAILVAFLIIFESFQLLKKAFAPLLDTAWSDEEIEGLRTALDEMKVHYHDLRTRISGSQRFIDMHIEVPENETVKDAHRYCDFIQNSLMARYDELSVIIHIEPVALKS